MADGKGKKKRLPVGIDIFEKLIRQDFYYVDKTGLIAELLRNWGEVNLFTRPRRFGKSLNMSMLRSFFEIGCDPTLFEGLKIEQESELCERYMGRFPVIAISLKGVEGRCFSDAVASIRDILGTEAMRFSFLEESPRLTKREKEIYRGCVEIANGSFSMSTEVVPVVLKNLSALLCRHYGIPVILLIDEYDVPLDKAYQNGYYDEMTALIRGIFGNVLKTNPNLYFAVLTGCLRIAKESIFTGLNNFNIFSITSVQFDEYFGFTDAEVRDMLSYYGLLERYASVKEWYNGYQFGRQGIYCPWDVINYCNHLCVDPTAQPEDYWSNTSGNQIIRRFIDKASRQTRDEMERLIEGETLEKEIRQDLTYNELDQTIENLWSVLFTTGYLTQRGRGDGRAYRLAIPNLEIRELFMVQIKAWFADTAAEDASKLNRFCEAFPAGDVAKVEELFNEYLWNAISVRDTAGKEKKENFYHGILLGLLSYKENWLVKSNAESGEGYSDILVEVPESRTGIVIELKYANENQMSAACEEALDQIEGKQYTARLEEDGMKTVLRYGIACYRKHCMVKLGD